MARTHRIDVTADDLEFGETKNSNRCAVKLAVERTIPGSSRVEVDLQTVRFTLNGERHVYLTPWEVQEYVIAYDAGDEEIEPFRFSLRQSVEIGSQVRQKERTEEGREVDRLRARVADGKKKKARAAATIADPFASKSNKARAEETLETIDEVIEERKRVYEETNAKIKESGVKQAKVKNRDRPRPPKRSKTREREFGRRVLRVNQAEGRTHTS